MFLLCYFLSLSVFVGASLLLSFRHCYSRVCVSLSLSFNNINIAFANLLWQLVYERIIEVIASHIYTKVTFLWISKCRFDLMKCLLLYAFLLFYVSMAKTSNRSNMYVHKMRNGMEKKRKSAREMTLSSIQWHFTGHPMNLSVCDSERSTGSVECRKQFIGFIPFSLYSFFQCGREEGQ